MESHYVIIYTQILGIELNSEWTSCTWKLPPSWPQPTSVVCLPPQLLGVFISLLSQFPARSAASKFMCWLTQPIKQKEWEIYTCFVGLSGSPLNTHLESKTIILNSGTKITVRLSMIRDNELEPCTHTAVWHHTRFGPRQGSGFSMFWRCLGWFLHMGRRGEQIL